MTATVLVTGGSGFIGSHVVDKLLARGLRPRILDVRPSPWHSPSEVETIAGDIRRVEDVERALRGCTAVCHLGAAADVGEVVRQPAWAAELNAMGTVNVLEAARQAEVERVVYASTVWVYSDVDADVVDEDALLPFPAHPYTAGKLSGELFCRSYAELYGLQPTVLRFGIPYGPRARPAAVIPSFVRRALDGEPLVIAGTGEQERTFVYVEDIADGVVRALAPQAAGRTYNLSGQATTTVRELAEIVRDEVGHTEIVHTEGRAGDLRGATVRSQRAAEEIDWSARTPLREGIRRYVTWVREQDAAAATGDTVAAIAAQPTASHRRRALAHLTSAATEPAVVGPAGALAVVSATVSGSIGAGDEQAIAHAAITLGLLLPLWVLTVTTWPAGLVRRQAALAAFWAAASVLLMGLLTGLATLHPPGTIAIVAASVSIAATLRTLPRRLQRYSA